ncbi:2-dehydro-3-deoxy-6-phosphogalactonate aldolase [Benzoatithermus flavus]|uniref:2-dehydro-3-deoxy-6-phosphogalactonate aldolase n=1 Tax=Benzoatithermus flavus TaxID=3108223 RepID=A0ABU8XXJ9_9PROT
MTSLADALRELPLVAILRGVRPEEVEAVAQALLEEGFRLIEVPLNSPEPLTSIRRLAARFNDRAVIGAGTVLSPTEAEAVAATGAKLVVAPNMDPAVIRAAKGKGLWCLPGVATPSEAFAALAAGADALKAFPAEGLPPAVIRAWRAVLPKDVPILPVGGIEPTTMTAYREAGAAGFGLGAALYKAGMSVAAVRSRAAAFVQAWRLYPG